MSSFTNHTTHGHNADGCGHRILNLDAHVAGGGLVHVHREHPSDSCRIGRHWLRDLGDRSRSSGFPRRPPSLKYPKKLAVAFWLLASFFVLEPVHADVNVVTNEVDGYTYGVSDSTLPAGFWNGALCPKADYDEAGYMTFSQTDFQLVQWVIPMEGVVSNASGTPVGYAAFPVTAEFGTHNGSEWRTWKSERTVPVPVWNGSSYEPQALNFSIWQGVSGTAPLEPFPTVEEGDVWTIRFYPTTGWGTATTTSLLIAWGNGDFGVLGSGDIGTSYHTLWRSRALLEDSFCQVGSYANRPAGSIVYDLDTDSLDATSVTSSIPESTYDGTFSEYLPQVVFSVTGTIAGTTFSDAIKTRIETFTGLQDRFPMCVAYPWLAFMELFQSWSRTTQSASAGVAVGGGIVGATSTLSFESADDVAAGTGLKEPAEFIFRALLVAGWVLFALRVILNQFFGQEKEN